MDDLLLAGELHRVLTCSYPASLCRLDKLVSVTEDVTIRDWVTRNPCRLKNLASITAEALGQWPYALRIIKRLCVAPKFRDELLRQNVELLDSFLRLSLRDFDQYADICVLLLSHPLPSTIPPPATAQALFRRLFDNAVKSSSAATFKPVHQILRGSGGALLNVVSEETKHEMSRQLCGVLFSKNPAQDTMQLLWCLSIALIMEAERQSGITDWAPSSLADPSPVTQRVGLEKRWETPLAKRLFGSTQQMLKTMTYTVLGVVWACKGNVGVSDSEAVEGIRVATQTMRDIDVEVRHLWKTSSDFHKNALRHLHEKALRKDLPIPIRLEVFSFFATLISGEKIPQDVVAHYQATLLELSKARVETSQLADNLPVSLAGFAPMFGLSFIEDLLRNILKGGTSQAPLRGVQAHEQLAKAMTACVPLCSELRLGILHALSSDDLQEHLAEFLKADPYQAWSPDSIDTTCTAQTLIIRRDYASTAVSLLLTAALTVQADEAGMSQSLAIKLIRKQQELGRPLTACTHSVSPLKSPTGFAVVEEACTPADEGDDTSWGQRLAMSLEEQSKHQNRLVLRTVAQMCHDLEERCDNVEQPLREEKRHAAQLETNVDELRSQISALEAEATDNRLMMDGLEAEKAQLESQLEQAEHERDQSSSRANDIQLELLTTKTRMDQAIHEGKSDFASMEVQLRATILSHEASLATRDEDLDGLCKTVDRLQNEVNEARAHGQNLKDSHDGLQETIQRLQNDVHEAHAQRQTLKDLHDSLQTQYEALQRELDSERCLSAQRAEEMAKMKTQEEDISSHLQTVQAILEEKATHLQGLQEQHERLQVSSKEEMDTLKAKHDAELDGMTHQATKQQAVLEEELHHCREACRQATEAYDASSEQLRRAQDQITDLESELQNLEDECSSKEEALQQFAALQTKLISRAPRRNERDRKKTDHEQVNSRIQRYDLITFPKSDAKLETPRASSRKEPVGGKTRHEQVDSKEQGAHLSFNSTSSSKSGPSPKRAKPTHTFKVPAIHTPRARRSASVLKLVPKRRALADVHSRHNQSPTRRHTTVGYGVGQDENVTGDEASKGRRGSLQSALESSFGGSDLFARTPATQDRQPDIDEESTIEF